MSAFGMEMVAKNVLYGVLPNERASPLGRLPEYYGDGTVTFTVKNVASAYSFFYHIIPDLDSPTEMMSNIEQTFQWTEPIDNSRGCGCG